MGGINRKYPLVMTNTLLLKMVIYYWLMDDLPIENGDLVRCFTHEHSMEMFHSY